MAKASTGRTAPARVKAAPPPAGARNKAKTSAEPKKKKAVAGKAAAKSAVPKTVARQPKAAAVKAGAKGKAAVAKAAGKKAGGAKSSAVAKKVASPRKAVAKPMGRSKTAAKTVAVKKAAPRRLAARTAVPVPAPRRGHPPAPATRKAPAQAEPRTAPQTFTVSHLDEADFKADGLRAYALYRDLGIAAATGGLCQAHVIRLVPPCTDDVRKRHQHQADLQLVYVLKGWMKNEFEGQGEQMMSAGSCWLQPSGIKHTVLDYSPDCEVLEIIVPADFKTEETV